MATNSKGAEGKALVMENVRVECKCVIEGRDD